MLINMLFVMRSSRGLKNNWQGSEGVGKKVSCARMRQRQVATKNKRDGPYPPIFTLLFKILFFYFIFKKKLCFLYFCLLVAWIASGYKILFNGVTLTKNVHVVCNCIRKKYKCFKRITKWSKVYGLLLRWFKPLTIGFIDSSPNGMFVCCINYYCVNIILRMHNLILPIHFIN